MANTRIGPPPAPMTYQDTAPTEIKHKVGDVVYITHHHKGAGRRGVVVSESVRGWCGVDVHGFDEHIKVRPSKMYPIPKQPGPPPPQPPSPQPTRRSLFGGDLGSAVDFDTVDTSFDFDTVDYNTVDYDTVDFNNVDNFSCSEPADAADAADAADVTGIGAMVNMTVPAPSPNVPNVPNVPLPFSPEAVAPIVQITPAAPNIGNKLGAAAGLYSPPTAGLDFSSPPTAPPPTSAALTIPSPNNSSSSGSGTFTHFDQRSDDFLNGMLALASNQLAGGAHGL